MGVPAPLLGALSPPTPNQMRGEWRKCCFSARVAWRKNRGRGGTRAREKGRERTGRETGGGAAREGGREGREREREGREGEEEEGGCVRILLECGIMLCQ